MYYEYSISKANIRSLLVWNLQMNTIHVLGKASIYQEIVLGVPYAHGLWYTQMAIWNSCWLLIFIFRSFINKNWSNDLKKSI